jgi:glutamate-ammonia-ligase adenylyltransferase
MLRVALADGADPRTEPKGFRLRLARVGGARSFAALETRLAKARLAARRAYEAVLGAD